MNQTSSTMRPKVGIVIVNHNLRESLRETLLSVRRIRYPDLQVVVSDNASTDGSVEMVRADFPEVKILAHNREQGYARAASLAMRELFDTTRYIFSTTNDVTFDPNIISVLVDYAEAHPETGVLGTRIYLHDRPNVLWHAGARIHPLHGHSYHYGWNRPDGERYNRVRECDFVTGCGFLLRTELLKKVGCFREDFVFYSEDAELCYRMREAGGRVVYVPEARMWHKTGTTLAKNRPVQLRYSTRNNLCLLQEHRVGWPPLTLWSHLFVVSPLKMGFFVMLGRWRAARGIWRGIQDWRTHRYGWIHEG